MRRKAVPNESSGHNPNTPVRRFDTHPNERLAIGEEVIPLDPAEPPVRGMVVGRAAEDRVWVEWPHTTSQEDVDDVIAVREWGYVGDLTDRNSMNRPRRSMEKEKNASRLANTELMEDYQEAVEDGDVEGLFLTLSKEELTSMAENLPSGNDQAMAEQMLKSQFGGRKSSRRRRRVAVEMISQEFDLRSVPLEVALKVLGEKGFEVKGSRGVLEVDIPYAKEPGSPGEREVMDILDEIEGQRKASHGPGSEVSRQQGIGALLKLSGLMKERGFPREASVIARTADVAAAMNALYMNPQTRAASADKVAYVAMRRASKKVLALTRDLRKAFKDTKKLANTIEEATARAFTYPRTAAAIMDAYTMGDQQVFQPRQGTGDDIPPGYVQSQQFQGYYEQGEAGAAGGAAIMDKYMSPAGKEIYQPRAGSGTEVPSGYVPSPENPGYYEQATQGPQEQAVMDAYQQGGQQVYQPRPGTGQQVPQGFAPNPQVPGSYQQRQ